MSPLLKNIKIALLALLCLVAPCMATAQHDYFGDDNTGAKASATSKGSEIMNSEFSISNTGYTSIPVRLPLSLAGSFAEIRPNHFHSGIDIRTDGKEGLPVYAPADGYVSRINISAWGGGKVLYITHPDGFRTVYMHLSAFCGDIGKFVDGYQRSHQIYAFDIDLPKDSILVKKGQLIALTGNTGGSMGPHLHYEIRLAENDQTINALYFGLPYSDPVAPTIAGIKVYPADKQTAINGKNSELRLPQPQKKKNGDDTITVAGRFYTGIYTYDQMEVGARNKNGVDKIELFVDGSLFHRYHVPTFMFEETRAVNAIIDYPQYLRSREYFILSRHLRGDRNNFNTAYRDNGYILFDDNNLHSLEYRVSDHKGNTSRRTFYVRSSPTQRLDTDDSTPLQPVGDPIAYFKHFNKCWDGFCVSIKPNTLYENDILVYSNTTDAGGLSPLHRIALRRHPLPPHQGFTVKIPVPENVAPAMHDKLTIVCVNGKNASALPTTIKNGMLEASSRSFGGFAVRLDTVAPTASPVNFKVSKPFNAKTLSVKISDNLSGVATYKCYVNGEWQLAEHDGKTSTLTIDAASLRKGANNLTVKLTDAVGNTSEKSWKITR